MKKLYSVRLVLLRCPGLRWPPIFLRGLTRRRPSSLLRSMTGPASTSAPTAAGARAVTAWISLPGLASTFTEGCRESIRRRHRRPVRLPLASQPVGVRSGSSGRLGGSQQPARQHLQSDVLYSHQNRWHRPFHRPDRLCMERLAALPQGRRGGDRATALASSIPSLALNWPRQARPAGVAPWVLDGSMASHRIGRPVSNTITCSWATRTIRSRLPIRVLSVS